MDIRHSSRFSTDLTTWKALYPDSSTTPADQLLGMVLAQFDQFREEFSAYFENTTSETQFVSAKTTPNRLRAQVLNTLDQYWTPLGRVAEQRQIKQYRDLLDQGTEMARKYLARLGLDLPGALVYFDKVTTIQRYPYTNIPFIGIPYYVMKSPGQNTGEPSESPERDWMGVAHEIGHYVYWNLKGDPTALLKHHKEIKQGAEEVLKQFLQGQQISADQSEALIAMLLPWQEEIFADILGTQLGGDEFICSLQTIIECSAGNADDLMQDDGIHPILYLRAWVREEALNPNGNSSRWDDFFKSQFKISEETLPEITIRRPINQQTIEAMTQENLLTFLKATTPNAPTEVTEFLSVKIPTHIAKAAIKKLVGYLRNYSPSAFKRLLSLAEQDNPAEPHSALLRPRIMEGGEQHSHYCLGHFPPEWHEHPAHNH